MLLTDPTQSDRPPQSAHPAGSETKLDKLTETIARSQQGYRDLIDSLDQALFTLSTDGEVRVANLRLAELLGVSFPGSNRKTLQRFR